MPAGIGGYASALSKETGPPFIGSVFGRLPFAMAPLGIIVLIQSITGSYGLASAVNAVYAAGTAVGGPLWGRLMDRFGPDRVVGPAAVGCGAMIALLGASATRWPLPAIIGVALVAGLLYPPLGAAMRLTWTAALGTPQSRQAAYALDAVSVEFVFIFGPLILSGLLLIGSPPLVLYVTGGLLAVGGLMYSLAPVVRGKVRDAVLAHHLAQAERRRTGTTRPAVTAPGVRPLMVTALGLSVAFGSIDVAVTGIANDVLGSTSMLGVLFAAMAGGSAIGGLYYGTRPVADVEHPRLSYTLWGVALSLVPVVFLLAYGQLRLLYVLPLFFLAGLSIAPSLIILQNTADRLAPPAAAGQIQAWIATAITVGAASGAALAGFIIDQASLAAAVVVPIVSLTTGGVLAWLWRDRWSRAIAANRRDIIAND